MSHKATVTGITFCSGLSLMQSQVCKLRWVYGYVGTALFQVHIRLGRLDASCVRRCGKGQPINLRWKVKELWRSIIAPVTCTNSPSSCPAHRGFAIPNVADVGEGHVQIWRQAKACICGTRTFERMRRTGSPGTPAIVMYGIPTVRKQLYFRNSVSFELTAAPTLNADSKTQRQSLS